MSDSDPSRSAVSSERIRLWAGYLAGMLASAMFLWPTMSTSWMADDSFNSLVTNRVLAFRHWTVIDYVWDWGVGWARTQGRFFPLASYIYFLFGAVSGNLLLYKIIFVVMLLLDIALFAVLVVQLTGSRSLGIAAMPIAVVMLQDTNFHDAVISFGTLLQMDFALVTGSLVLFLLYLRKGRSWHLWVSVALYACALLTYEVIALLVLLFPLAGLMYGRRRPARDVARTVWPYFATVLAAVVVTLGLRVAFNVPIVSGARASAYAPNFSPIQVLPTFAKQVFAALPLSFAIAKGAGESVVIQQPFGSLSFDLRVFPITSLATFLSVGGVFAYGLWASTRALDEARRPVDARLLSAFGLAYLGLPALVISLSPEWQRSLTWGIGYLPVYLEFFGSALIVLALSYWLVRISPAQLVRPLVIGILAIAIGLVAVVTFQDNRAEISVDNRSWNYARTVMYDALQHGVAAGLTNGDSVVNMLGSPFMRPELIYDADGVMPAWVSAPSDLSLNSVVGMGFKRAPDVDGYQVYAPSSTSKRLWCLGTMSTKRGTGAVLFSRVTAVAFKNGTALGLDVTPIRGFAITGVPNPDQVDSWSGPSYPSNLVPTMQNFRVDPSTVSIDSKASGWALYRMSGEQTLRVAAQ